MNLNELDAFLFTQNASETEALVRRAAGESTDRGFSVDADGYVSTDVLYEGQIGMFHICRQNRYAEEPRHRHHYFEMLVVYAGKADQEIGGRPVSMRAGDVCLIGRRAEHRILPLGAGDIVLRLQFKPRLFTGEAMFRFSNNPLIRDFFVRDVEEEGLDESLVIHTDGDAQFLETLRLIYFEYLNADSLSVSAIAGCFPMLFAVLARIIRRTGKTDGGGGFGGLLSDHILSDAGSDRNALQNADGSVGAAFPRRNRKLKADRQEILSYLQQFYRQCTLEDLAKRFGYASTYMSAIIRKETGRSFQELRTEYRMEEAARRLRTSGDAVREIALDVGYQNLSQFYQDFRKRYGMTPKAYRKQQKQ